MYPQRMFGRNKNNIKHLFKSKIRSNQLILASTIDI